MGAGGPGRLVNVLLTNLQSTVQRAGLMLASEVAPGVLPVRGDRAHLRWAMDNLLDNALKFTPAGGSITVRLRQEETNVVLEVADTGIGIPSDKLDRIFERFYRWMATSPVATAAAGWVWPW